MLPAFRMQGKSDGQDFGLQQKKVRPQRYQPVHQPHQAHTQGVLPRKFVQV